MASNGMRRRGEFGGYDYAIKNIGLFKTSQNVKWAYYTYLWLKSSFGNEFIQEYRSGSTQEYISLGGLRSIVFRKPEANLLDSFNERVIPIFNRIKLNSSMVLKLEMIRDSLLPKLMSGEVQVEL